MLFDCNSRREADVPETPRLRFLRTGCKVGIITWQLCACSPRKRMQLPSGCIYPSPIAGEYGLPPTVLDLVMVVGDYRVGLTWSIPLRTRHNVTVSSEFVDVLLQFVVAALLGSGRE